MDELLKDIKKYTDERKKQIQEFDFEQISAGRKVQCYSHERN